MPHMTLYRQLFLFILFLFVFFLAIAWFSKLESTRSFLIDQLQSHAQDTATSLGLSVSPYTAEDDMASVETMINAVFDRGYYTSVTFKDMNGEIMVQKILPLKVENVPEWFFKLISLKTLEGTANVMTGWQQAGTIYVQSHPGYAYKTLWETAVRMTIWFAVSGFVMALLGAVGLSYLLQPLRRVEEQADALCRKQYDVQKHLPRTKELRRVVEAMNRMTGKIKDMFEEQASIAERLRSSVYRDDLTGFGNRRYFQNQVSARLEGREIHAKGVLLLLQVNALQELNRQEGFQAGDELLIRVADLLRSCTSKVTTCVLSRLTGGDFAVFLPDASSWEAEHLAKEIANELAQLAVEKRTYSDNLGHVGGVSYDCPTSYGRLLSEADLALRTAQRSGPNSWEVRGITTSSEQTPQGQQEWKTALEWALQEGQVSLLIQTVVMGEDKKKTFHREIFSSIRQQDGALLSAGIFMPFAERLKLIAALDKIVLEKVMCLDKVELGCEWIAVNISPTTLEDNLFRKWLSASLRSLPESVPRIYFEFSEYSAVQHLERVKEFGVDVRELGHGIALDHFGQSFSNLGYLHSLKPQYVKIERAYVAECKERNSDSCFLINSLCSVAHSIDIAVIAAGVESQSQWNMLSELRVDAMQGFFIDKPELLPDKDDLT